MSFSLDIESLKPTSYAVPTVSNQWSKSDYWGALKVRIGFGRNDYKTVPGIYKIGNPDQNSDVFLSANYKLSFDTLRKNLHSFNAWILVIDTQGINVWCAAGKGTFGTENLVQSIKKTRLDKLVTHRNIIVPQLGAPGISAHKVLELSEFRVIYGPVRAFDIKQFVQSGYKATPEMRKVNFSMLDRAKLIPNDFVAGLSKLLLLMLALFFISGLDKTGFLFSKMIHTSLFPLSNLVGAYIAGLILTPLFLSWVPFRAFALKGAVWALIITYILHILFQASIIETSAMALINLSLASYAAMNFTGSSTYTSLSGVKKEMKYALPIQIAIIIIGIIVFIISKLL